MERVFICLELSALPKEWYNIYMEEVESRIIDYKDIKLKIIKRKDGEFIFEYIRNVFDNFYI